MPFDDLRSFLACLEGRGALRHVRKEVDPDLEIGAIQELTKKVKELEDRQQRFAELEQKARRVEALEEELSGLRKLVTRLAQANPAKRRRPGPTRRAGGLC